MNVSASVRASVEAMANASRDQQRTAALRNLTEALRAIPPERRASETQAAIEQLAKREALEAEFEARRAALGAEFKARLQAGD
jgi:hypothetical protein